MKVYIPAISGHVPPGVVRTFVAFTNFCYTARREVLDTDSIAELRAHLEDFRRHRVIFEQKGVRPDKLSLPRSHSLGHYADSIEEFGAPNGLCSSITESKHIKAVKEPWRRSSKHKALQQILLTNQRLDKLAAARTVFKAAGMMEGDLEAEILAALGEEPPGEKDGEEDDEDFDEGGEPRTGDAHGGGAGAGGPGEGEGHGPDEESGAMEGDPTAFDVLGAVHLAKKPRKCFSNCAIDNVLTTFLFQSVVTLPPSTSSESISIKKISTSFYVASYTISSPKKTTRLRRTLRWMNVPRSPDLFAFSTPHGHGFARRAILLVSVGYIAR